MKWYSMNLNKCNKCMEEDTAKVYLTDDVDKHIEELKQRNKELEQDNKKLRSLLWQCKKWHIEPRLEALKEIATEEQQGLLNIFNGHLQQAEQLLKGGE